MTLRRALRLSLAVLVAGALGAGCTGGTGSSASPDGDDGGGAAGGGAGGGANVAPSVTIDSVTGSSGDITISFTLTDANGDACSIAVEYAGGTADPNPLPAKVVGSTANLAPGSHSIVWESMADEFGISDSYDITITPSDGTAVGTAVTHQDHDVDNDRSPVVTLTGSVYAAGNVTIDFDLAESDLQNSDIEVQYRGGSTYDTWTAATVAAGGDDTDLPPAEATYQLIWQIGVDEAGHCGNNYQVRLRAKNRGLVTLDIRDGQDTGDWATSDTNVADESGGANYLEVWGCGRNHHGQLGQGTTTDVSSPARALVITNITAIAAGDNHTVALDGNGNLWTWGDNTYGQLGYSGAGRSTPALLSETGVGGVKVVAIAAGAQHTVALDNNGEVWTWGGNGQGQLGLGDTTDRSAPQKVAGLAGITLIAAGGYHTLVTDGASVWAWGDNQFGQLGDDSTTDRDSPVTYALAATALAAGEAHSLAIVGGSLWSWGLNDVGQLGLGDNADRDQPANTTLAVAGIAAGLKHTVALTAAGAVRTTGRNLNGQLGDGTNVDSNAAPAAMNPAVNTGAAVAAGGYHTAIAEAAGTALACGYNDYGQVGDDSTSSRSAPTAVSTMTDVGLVAGGLHHTVYAVGIDDASAAAVPAALYVPGSDFVTIQGAIDAARPGDRVVVMPGEYFENLNFRGKAIAVQSQAGPQRTILNGPDGSIPTVSFITGEGRRSVLRGFTVRGGQVGVLALDAGPTLADNVLESGLDCGRPLAGLGSRLSGWFRELAADSAVRLGDDRIAAAGRWLAGDASGVLAEALAGARRPRGGADPAPARRVPPAGARGGWRAALPVLIPAMGLLALAAAIAAGRRKGRAGGRNGA
jgi:alpha-tubulin suppressor-like RCC1 family protein